MTHVTYTHIMEFTYTREKTVSLPPCQMFTKYCAMITCTITYASQSALLALEC